MSRKSLIKKIHASPFKAVIATTGGGAGAFDMLLNRGGGSATLLDGMIPYSEAALAKFLRGRPDKFCCPITARDMAMAAYHHACELNGGASKELLIGVGCTATLVKDGGEREGRVHAVHLAVQTYSTTVWYELRLDGYDLLREEEERLAAEAVLIVLADACDVITENEIKFFPECLAKMLRGGAISKGTMHDQRIDRVTMPQVVATSSTLEFVQPSAAIISSGSSQSPIHSAHINSGEDDIIFPGSFNPIHEQHQRMAHATYDMTGKRVSLEICIKNVDKPALNYHEIAMRVNSLITAVQNEPWYGGIYVTNAGTFADKSELFKNRTFMMGWDVYQRLNDAQYGNLDVVTKRLVNNDAKFLVFHRILDDVASYNTVGFAEITQWTRPEIYAATTIVPPNKIVVSDLSSSGIRKKVTT